MNKIDSYLKRFNDIDEFYESLDKDISDHLNNINIELEGSLSINMDINKFNGLSINLMYPELKQNFRRYISYAEDYFKGRNRE